uniref:Uncharacterized protein n=1 Tax=Rhinolophus ferrumequinum TaxID=59479 RepID=A0A671DYE6_RHIFE
VRSSPKHLNEVVCSLTVLFSTKENRSLPIKLRRRKPEKKVEWTSDTVDNAHMGQTSGLWRELQESDEEEEEGCGHTHCVRGHRKGRSRAVPGPSPTTPPSLLTPPSPLQGQFLCHSHL